MLNCGKRLEFGIDYEIVLFTSFAFGKMKN